jgi:hypothetical protein
LCIDARGYEGSLYRGKVYRVIKPERNDSPTDMRVVDEEGEDYLYSADQFVPLELPLKARRAMSSTS